MFWTSGFSYIPLCVLAVIVIVAVIGFVHVAEARRLWRVERTDFWLMTGAFAATVGLGVEFGVLAAVAASIVVVVYRATNPRVPELGWIPGTDVLVEIARHPSAETFHGAVILRPESPLYFTNAETVERRLRTALERDGTHTLAIDMSGVDQLDATADHMLRELVVSARSTRFVFVHVQDRVRDVMDASGLSTLVGDDAFLATDAELIDRLRELRDFRWTGGVTCGGMGYGTDQLQPKRARMPEMNTVTSRGFFHEAVLYSSDDEFLDGTLQFVRDGFEAGEPTLVVVARAKVRALRAELEHDGERLYFADMEEVGSNPACIIPAWTRFVAEHGARGPLRGVGEPVWPGRSTP